MVTVDENKCGACGRCVAFCPREALNVTTWWGRLYIDKERCTDCFGGACHFEENLPLADKEATLDRNRTTWTRLCVENCPVSAISVVEEPNG